MPPLAAFEAVDPLAPRKPATPVAELAALEPGEPGDEILRWYPRCCGCGHPWGPGLVPAAWLVTLPERRRLPLCQECAEPEPARRVRRTARGRRRGEQAGKEAQQAAVEITLRAERKLQQLEATPRNKGGRPRKTVPEGGGFPTRRSPSSASVGSAPPRTPSWPRSRPSSSRLGSPPCASAAS